MANVAIGYKNVVDSATLSSGSYAATLPITNLQDSRISKRARTTGVGLTRNSSAIYYGASGLMATASNGVMRLSYDPSTLAGPTPLTEESATNYLLRSEEFDNASWSKGTDTSHSANSMTDPFGTTTADKITEANTNNSNQHLVQQNAATTNGTNTYTFSIFLRAGERSAVQLSLMDNVTTTNAIFLTVNLSTGAIYATSASGSATLVGYGVIAHPNGWYRCWLSGTTGTANTVRARVMIQNPIGSNTYTGSTGSGIYAWGGMVEAGASPTSYIATTTASASRSADVLNARVDVDLGATALLSAVTTVALAGHNLSASAKIRVTANSTTSMQTPAYDSGWVSAYQQASDVGKYPGLWAIQTGLGAWYRYMRVEVYDPSNTAGYVEYGRLFLGTTFQPANNVDFGWSLGYEDPTAIEQSLGGAEFFDIRPKFRVTKCGYSWLDETTSAAAWELVRNSGVSGEVVLLWDTADVTTFAQRSYLGRLRTLSPLENPDPVRYSTAFEIKETVA